MPLRIWTQRQIITAIRAEAQQGHDLCYSRTAKRVPALLRAAERLFGSWRGAVAAAGFDYDAIRRYRVWSKKRVIEKIRELHQQGVDVSWRYVSKEADPPLAAAALHAGRFPSWNAALRAAGLDPDTISRYRRWTKQRIHDELQSLMEQGVVINQDNLAREAPALLAAIYRISGSLPAARAELSAPRQRAGTDWRTAARYND
jgi:hypothetical protein